MMTREEKIMLIAEAIRKECAKWRMLDISEYKKIAEDILNKFTTKNTK